MTQVSALPPLELEQEGGVLTVYAFADPDDPGQRFLLLQERCVGVSSARFAALPVTSRERQVLTWLTAGKTDREIAAILGLSVRTIQKHLEHVYVKLGVETRTAAAMRALAMADAAWPQSKRPAPRR
jgi:DNA-binding NarL/FixJ family response regulator